MNHSTRAMRRCAAIFALPLLAIGCAISAEEPTEPTATTADYPQESATGVSAQAMTQAECDEQHIERFQVCWKAEPPLPLKKGDAGHYKHCASTCLGKYMDCLSKAVVLRTFDSLKSATEWLPQHPEVVVGTVVGVAGAPFVVSTGSAGALLLLSLEG
jgi:hypothetical protein